MPLKTAPLKTRPIGASLDPETRLAPGVGAGCAWFPVAPTSLGGPRGPPDTCWAMGPACHWMSLSWQKPDAGPEPMVWQTAMANGQACCQWQTLHEDKDCFLMARGPPLLSEIAAEVLPYPLSSLSHERRLGCRPTVSSHGGDGGGGGSPGLPGTLITSLPSPDLN